MKKICLILECYKKNIISVAIFTSGSYFCSAPVCFVSRTSKIYDIHKGFFGWFKFKL